jgi:hypothetical protein
MPRPPLQQYSAAAAAAAASGAAGAGDLYPVDVGARAAARNRSESVNSASEYSPDALEPPLGFLPLAEMDTAQLQDYRYGYI